MPNEQTKTTEETEKEFIIRRMKEILGMAGFDAELFSVEEKIISAITAQQEWDEAHA